MRSDKQSKRVVRLVTLSSLIVGTIAILALPRVSPSRRTVRSTGSTAIVKVSGRRAGPRFAPGAIGLSIEPTAFAWHHLQPSGNLGAMMRLLGPIVLRIGGNAADLSFWRTREEPRPSWARTTVTPAALRRLAALVRATRSRAVLAVNLGHLDPRRAAGEAVAAAHFLGRSLLGIEMGNEPDLYPGHGLRTRPAWNFKSFASGVVSYRSALAAETRGVPTVGPDLSHLYWSMRYAETLGRRDREITQHYYALWACPGTARPSIHALLGGRVRAVEDKLLARLSGAAVTAGRPAAISETNSVGCNGTAGVSRTFASSLWALDWVLRAASAGVARIGFHDLLQRCTARTYSPLCARRPGQTLALAPQPDFYGLLAAARLENGWFMHVTVRGPSYLTAYATRAAGGTIHLALDDMDTRNASHTVIVRLDGRYRASVERLTGPRLGATRGVRFGAAMVSSSGGFRPHGRPLRDRAGSLGLKLPGGSAAVLTLTPLR